MLKQVGVPLLLPSIKKDVHRINTKRKKSETMVSTDAVVKEASNALKALSKKMETNNEDDAAFARFIISRLKQNKERRY